MRKVERYSNWCEIDQLNGKDIADGEVLSIRFHDGTVETHAVKVIKKKRMISDMGSPYELPISKAYAVTDYHGVQSLVPIVGLEAKRL